MGEPRDTHTEPPIRPPVPSLTGPRPGVDGGFNGGTTGELHNRTTHRTLQPTQPAASPGPKSIPACRAPPRDLLASVGEGERQYGPRAPRPPPLADQTVNTIEGCDPPANRTTWSMTTLYTECVRRLFLQLQISHAVIAATHPITFLYVDVLRGRETFGSGTAVWSGLAYR